MEQKIATGFVPVTEKQAWEGCHFYEITMIPIGDHSTKSYNWKFITDNSYDLRFLKTWVESMADVKVHMVKEIMEFVKTKRPYGESTSTFTLRYKLKNEWKRTDTMMLPFPKEAYRNVQTLQTKLGEVFGSDCQVVAIDWN